MLANAGGGAFTVCTWGAGVARTNSGGGDCRNPAQGGDAVVALGGTATADRYNATIPIYIILGHELIHALQATHGRNSAGAAYEASTIGTYNGFVGNAVNAIPGVNFSENLLRGESTYINRGSGNSVTPLQCRDPHRTGQFAVHGGGQTHC
jgi:hypothetical protein